MEKYNGYSNNCSSPRNIRSGFRDWIKSMIGWIKLNSKLVLLFMPVMSLMSCSAGAGRYSVDGQALKSTWMLVGILFGGFILYSIIKNVFGSKNNDKNDKTD